MVRDLDSSQEHQPEFPAIGEAQGVDQDPERQGERAVTNVKRDGSLPLPALPRGEGGVRGSLSGLDSRRVPLTRNSLPRISTSPRKRDEVRKQAVSRLN